MFLPTMYYKSTYFYSRESEYYYPSGSSTFEKLGQIIIDRLLYTWRLYFCFDKVFIFVTESV